jgi:photosystem II stability/assembly factor-like uncharacterized protein
MLRFFLGPAALILPMFVGAQQPMAFDPASMATPLRFRYIGPVGNRVASVAGIPGDANTYYAGAASGGIWKTTDAGIHWAPIFDDQSVSSVGAMAVAVSNPNIVWAGTGEPWIRSHISVGTGVYKSTDAGRTWTHAGLDSSGRVGRIVIDPNNPDIVFVAAQGHSYGPQQDRGLYRTTDGGKTWTRVLFVDANTGAIDVVMHPADSKTLFAAMWQLELHTWGRESGGAGSGLYVSHDGGSNWTKLQGNGLPTHEIGKAGLAISRSNPNRVYALIETGDGNPLHGRPTDTVSCGAQTTAATTGASSATIAISDADSRTTRAWMSLPTIPTRRISSARRSITRSTAARRSVQLVAAAVVGVEREVRSRRLASPHPAGTTTTSGSIRRIRAHRRRERRRRSDLDDRAAAHGCTSNSRSRRYITPRSTTEFLLRLATSRTVRLTGDRATVGQATPLAREWHGVRRREWMGNPDPVDPNLIWSTASGSGSRGGIVVRFDERARQGQNVEVWPLSAGGIRPVRSSIASSGRSFHDLAAQPQHRLHGQSFVHVTKDSGRTAGDQSRSHAKRQIEATDVRRAHAGQHRRLSTPVSLRIAESRVQPGVIWTGSNDGLVQVTRDAGKTWTNVTGNVPGIPMWGSVRHVEPSRYAAGSAYIIVDAHQENNRDPWVYKTTDFGKTWKLIITGIPKSMLSYAHIIREDPVRRGLLYLGTENALYVSFDDGDHSQPMQLGMPHAPVYGLVIQEHFNDLVVATYGRGFFILDDLTPLQKLTPAIIASPRTCLLRTRPTVSATSRAMLGRAMIRPPA